MGLASWGVPEATHATRWSRSARRLLLRMTVRCLAGPGAVSVSVAVASLVRMPVVSVA